MINVKNEWIRLAVVVFASTLMTAGAGAIAQTFNSVGLGYVLTYIAGIIVVCMMPEATAAYQYESP